MQPDLIRYVCISYDMRPHSTKIFQEWINTLSHYVQLVLASPSAGDELSKESTPGSSAAHQPGPNQSLLYYKGVFFPTIQPKSLLLDLLDRGEPPVLADGYCLSVAIACVTQIVQSLEIIVHDANTVSPSVTDIETNAEPKTTEVDKQLVALSWCGCLSALALLLEASADEKVTTNVLQALHTMIGLTGQLGADAALDAFVTTMCKASLPSSYARSLFSAPSKGLPTNNITTPVVHEEAFERSPVVIVVTQGAGHSINITPASNSSTGVPGHPGSGSSSTAGSSHTSSTSVASGHDSTQNFPPGSLLITAKHLQAAKAVLHSAQTHGNVLGRSWNVILTTLQNLVWMLGLKMEPDVELLFKPTPNSTGAVRNADMSATAPGSAKSAGAPPATSGTSASNQPRPPVFSSSITVSTDLATLSSMLSALFAQSSQLSVNALNDLVLGLTQLSSEAMEAVSLNKGSKPFPITKLTELGLVNMNRLQLWWDSVCCQLLSMCKLSHAGLRQMAASALVVLIKQAIAAPQQPPFWKNESLTMTVLDPLSSLSEVVYDDVREKQLECVQHMLHCWGEQIGTSWLRVIEIVGVIRDSYKVDLILIAFHCFKLIVTDYLSSLSPDCYAACVVTAARFGHQKQDLNIALTAIGHILHLADHLLPKGYPSENLSDKTSTGNLSLEELWISIFCHLADLCLDRRPAIRKSACQTLFNTVECHGTRFRWTTWSALFWKVLFPLLKNVHELFTSAPVEREGRSNSLLVHHSRDTAAKQWAETVVLTLTGVSNLIVSKQAQLLTLAEFPKVWTSLLDHIMHHALTASAEISTTALASLQNLLDLKPSEPQLNVMLWPAAWSTWLEIGTKAVHFQAFSEIGPCSAVTDTSQHQLESTTVQSAESPPYTPFLPTAAFMTLMFDLFVPLFSRCIEAVSTQISPAHWTRLTEILHLGSLAPIYVTYLYPQSSVTLLPLVDDGTLSPLQESVLRDLNFLLQASFIYSTACLLHSVVKLLEGKCLCCV
ncbi:hypothetical protein FGIG_01002 [Fasciola gigantica]|uniref:Protein MON2 homolog n=1 Tax=Fasciola gigantica TaxID=46835 RepID=A0A504YG93_FASGI|nr:hypothetical protein FGIG_01002 [Fasciola gigantica]